VLPVSRHLEALAVEGRLLVEAATAAGPDAAVPTCPDWTVADLLLHTAGVHRWAAEIVNLELAEPGSDEEYFRDGPRDLRVIDEYAEAHAALCTVLSSAPADLDCFTFLSAPSPLAFWARRQCFETAIHRADADSATAIATTYDPALAGDGIDELLTGFVPRPRSRLRADKPWTLTVTTTDTAQSWTVWVSEEPPVVERTLLPRPTCSVVGPASDVFLLLWNRAGLEGVQVDGEVERMADWAEHVRVRWS
jgi:uncharacterized protein (TIGR03083 family)